MSSSGALISPRSEKFEEAQFMRDLVHLKDTQDAIQALSAWCLRNRRAAYKIARCWLKVIKKVKPEQKLVLVYLFNDIVQHSKRKNATELLDKCEGVLKEAMPYLKEDRMGDKVRRVQRVVQIWGERQIFQQKFLDELAGLLDDSKQDQEIVDNFQPQQLCTQLKIMKALEDDTDYKHKTLKENDVDLNDVEALRHDLKDRQHGNDFINDFEEGRKRMEQYIKALEREITKRRQVVELLTQGGKYYESLLGEATIVATAYHNFGKRVKILKDKLQEKIPELDLVSISPIPSPDYDAPSPEADEMELELPEDGQPSAIIAMNEPVDQSYGGEGRHQHHHHHNHHHQHHGSGDLSSRLDSMMGSIPGASRNATSASHPTDPPRSSSSSNNYTISEYLTKLATGESVDNYSPSTSSSTKSNGQDKTWWAKNDWQQPPPPPPQQPAAELTQQEDWPPPHHEWPAPQPDPYEQVTQAEPVPEWQFQTEDEEPPADDDEVYNENIALARLNKKSVVSRTEDVNHARPHLMASSSNRRSTEMDMSSDDDNHQHGRYSRSAEADGRHSRSGDREGRVNGQSHESSEDRHASLQERLRHLAGVPASELDGPKLGHRSGPPPQQPRFSEPPPSFSSSSRTAPPPSFERSNFEPQRFDDMQRPPPMFGNNLGRGFLRIQSPHQRPRGGGFHPPGGFRGGRPPRRGPRW